MSWFLKPCEPFEITRMWKHICMYGFDLFSCSLPINVSQLACLLMFQNFQQLSKLNFSQRKYAAFPSSSHSKLLTNLLRNLKINYSKMVRWYWIEIQMWMFHELPGKETVSVSQWKFRISCKHLTLVVNNMLGHWVERLEQRYFFLDILTIYSTTAFTARTTCAKYCNLDSRKW